MIARAIGAVVGAVASAIPKPDPEVIRAREGARARRQAFRLVGRWQRLYGKATRAKREQRRRRLLDDAQSVVIQLHVLWPTAFGEAFPTDEYRRLMMEVP